MGTGGATVDENVVQDKNVGAKGKRAVYDVATQHRQVVTINCVVPHGRRVKGFVAQLRMEYVRAMQRGPVVVLGYYSYDPNWQSAETEVDREVKMFVQEMGLQDMSYNGAPGPSHYPAQKGNTEARIDAVYADPQCVRGVTAGYIVGPEKMRDRKGHCRMMVTVQVKVVGPGDDEDCRTGVKRGGGQPADAREVARGRRLRHMATMGATGARRNEIRVPCVLRHEELGTSVWVHVAWGRRSHSPNCSRWLPS